MFPIVLVVFIFLCILYFLFVFYFHIRVIIDDYSLRIKLFRVTIFYKKDEKFKDFFISMIPKDTTTFKYDLDLSSLNQFIHFDLVDLSISYRVNDYFSFTMLNNVVYNVLTQIESVITNKIKKIHYSLNQGHNSHIKMTIKLRFNLGTLLINYLLIRSNYVKKTSKWVHSTFFREC